MKFQTSPLSFTKIYGKESKTHENLQVTIVVTNKISTNIYVCFVSYWDLSGRAEIYNYIYERDQAFAYATTVLVTKNRVSKLESQKQNHIQSKV